MSSYTDNMEKFSQMLDFRGMDHKEYQYEGVKWCINNELRENPLCQVRGGFIADEMGLGKTILMIGTMISNPLHKTLIVLPPILLQQWEDQLTKSYTTKPLLYHGSNKKNITKDTIQNSPVVICSYAGITMNKEQIEGKYEHTLLHQVKWDRIIFDESHHMRNSTTKLYSSAILLQADIRWLVSGTPVQNSKKDLYNLCSMLRLPPSFYTNKDNLNQLAINFILKRTKKQIGIQMPDLHKKNQIVDWNNNSEKIFSQQIHRDLEFSNVSSSHYDTLESTNDAENVERAFDKLYQGRGHKLAMMIKAKQSCIMPKLTAKSFEQRKINTTSFQQVFTSSSKIDKIVNIITQRKDNGSGKILFCNYKNEIDEFYNILSQLKLKVAIIDGRVSKMQRNKILSEPYDVLILQIQTGCEGLNLQEFYSEIYFVSPSWNPATEDQAIARCHRIGQTKPVYVFKFYMNGFDDLQASITIESYTNDVQEFKREVANNLIN